MSSLTTNVNEKANLIWSIADKLTGAFKPHEYGLVILPLTVLKRFDCVLEDTKEEVVKQAEKLPMTFAQRDLLLKEKAKHNFYNTSKYDFKKLLDDPDNIEENLENYINGFSKEAKDIIDKFGFETQITKMANKNILYSVIEEFNSSKADLHPDKITNIEMGYIFEEIIRRFSESHNEDAGQHYTPREVIELMVNVIFDDDKDLANSSKIKTVYDGACGTGGMLSASMEYMKKINSSSKLLCFGQELNDETYAICKADMLIKGEDSENIKDGNTLSDDQFAGETFDYVIMNPPFGREWKNEKDAVEKEAKKGFEGRFGAGTPAISDSQLLFLQNAVSKMNPVEKGGGKVAIIHNGSALWNGEAGKSESNIRQYLIEKDLIDCIIQLPKNLFYNTAITTYILILSNKKPQYRKNKIQLINAENLFKKMRKGLGYKKNEILREQIDKITKIYGDYVQNKYCKIYENDFFGYKMMTVNYTRIENGREITEKTKEFVPLNEDLEKYFKEKVLIYYPNAIYDKNKVKVGYSIDFVKYFHEPLKFEKVDEIQEKINEMNNEIKAEMKDLFEKVNTRSKHNGINEFQKVKHCFNVAKEKALQEDPIVLSLARDGIRIRDISTNEGQLAESYYEYNPVKKNDLLLNPMDLVSGANCTLSDKEGVISPAYINLRNKKGICSKYYDYYFKIQYWNKNFFANGKGVSVDNRWTLNNDTLMNYQIPKLEYNEQCEIANDLDQKVKIINGLKEKLNAELEMLENYKRAIINDEICGNE